MKLPDLSKLSFQSITLFIQYKIQKLTIDLWQIFLEWSDQNDGISKIQNLKKGTWKDKKERMRGWTETKRKKRKKGSQRQECFFCPLLFLSMSVSEKGQERKRRNTEFRRDEGKEKEKN